LDFFFSLSSEHLSSEPDLDFALHGLFTVFFTFTLAALRLSPLSLCASRFASPFLTFFSFEFAFFLESAFSFFASFFGGERDGDREGDREGESPELEEDADELEEEEPFFVFGGGVEFLGAPARGALAGVGFDVVRLGSTGAEGFSGFSGSFLSKSFGACAFAGRGVIAQASHSS